MPKGILPYYFTYGLLGGLIESKTNDDNLETTERGGLIHLLLSNHGYSVIGR